ncbi:MAG: hypothetical protein ACOX68_07980 [Candidatus Limivicinus sp.]|jgi:hypothetical protein
MELKKVGKIEKPEDQMFELRADTVTVEVKDSKTGKVFRRELPIDFYENANFLRLRGENIEGGVSELVFFTQRGVERFNDISGHGEDHDNC